MSFDEYTLIEKFKGKMFVHDPFKQSMDELKILLSQNKIYGVVYNLKYGGYPYDVNEINDEIKKKFLEYSGKELIDEELHDRTNISLVYAVLNSTIKERIGEYHKLSVAFIDSRFDYNISEYDGAETVTSGKIKGCKCGCTCILEEFTNN